MTNTNLIKYMKDINIDLESEGISRLRITTHEHKSSRKEKKISKGIFLAAKDLENGFTYVIQY